MAAPEAVSKTRFLRHRSHIRAAATSAATTVVSVGSTTGAENGEWFDGCSATAAIMSATPRRAKAAKFPTSENAHCRVSSDME